MLDVVVCGVRIFNVEITKKATQTTINRKNI